MTIELNQECFQKPYGLIIGDFDGVHRGHQFIFNEMKKQCDELSLVPLVITYKPNTKIVIRNIKTDFLLNNYLQKINLIKELGIENIVEVEFDEILSKSDPTDFLNMFKTNNLNMMFLGHDFKIGPNKNHGLEFIKEYAAKNDIKLYNFSEFKDESYKITSTEIRKLINRGEIFKANKFLGYSFNLSGSVIKGKQLGRQIGFPTANLEYDPLSILPKKGVYKSRVKVQGDTFDSITNVGLNPSISEGSALSIETHILNFDEDIYDKGIELEFIDFIRDEVKFSNIDELKIAIKNDIEKVKND